MLVAVHQSSDGLQAAIARAINVNTADAAATAAAAAPVLKTAVLNLTRPLFVAPVITMAHVGVLCLHPDSTCVDPGAQGKQLLCLGVSTCIESCSKSRRV
jgi:hypothetical protein